VSGLEHTVGGQGAGLNSAEWGQSLLTSPFSGGGWFVPVSSPSQSVCSVLHSCLFPVVW
jgi:hypothetical protein